MEKRPSQRIRYFRTPDGVQLAWAEAGAGPPLIKASNWLSHLEYEWESPVWRHWIRFFDKLGVWTRAQAIVFARDRGFR
jgi:hypothetical protein